MARIIFVTGTDTHVGKTVLTALLLTHLRAEGCHCLAMKPFCSGSPRDAQILFRAQDGEIPQEKVNPFYFRLPAAPLVAARRTGRKVTLREVVRKVRQAAAGCDILLVEGAGGLYAPLGEGYMVADLIAALDSSVLLVACNKLGAINHTLLTLRALQGLAVPRVKIVLMDARKSELTARTNFALLRELARPAEIYRVPFLGRNPAASKALRVHEKKLKKTLAALAETSIFSTASSRGAGRKR